MVSTNITTADTLSTKATKALDTMRARIVKADAARTAAEAWDALATYAARHAADARHGAELAQRTRRRWAR